MWLGRAERIVADERAVCQLNRMTQCPLLGPGTLRVERGTPVLFCLPSSFFNRVPRRQPLRSFHTA